MLEALGVKLELGPEQVAQCVEQVGFGFMFAPTYHPAMRHVGPTRREIGIRTIFNILGPLTNPAHVRYQVLGVPDPKLLRLMGEALLRLGGARALVVYGEDGVDELSLAGPTRVCEVDGAAGALREYTVTPEDVGCRPRHGRRCWAATRNRMRRCCVVCSRAQWRRASGYGGVQRGRRPVHHWARGFAGRWRAPGAVRPA